MLRSYTEKKGIELLPKMGTICRKWSLLCQGCSGPCPGCSAWLLGWLLLQSWF